ncbi:hypothetical protein C8R46DRAFT_918135 [Mycena filopes]|nr:hypothetical protein C8R46DRAFT_918135 [Mycena filopes]
MALCRALRLLAFYALTRFRACNSTAANYTIDDLKGDVRTGVLPVYEPLSMWNADGNCNVCVIHPDPKKAVEGTWHDATQTGKTPPTVTIQFTGTAIYMFGIVPNNIPRAATHVNLTFTLDSVPQTGYAHTPDNSSNMAYAVPIFATSGLTNGSHTLVARTTNAPALFIFDYALYT